MEAQLEAQVEARLEAQRHGLDQQFKTLLSKFLPTSLSTLFEAWERFCWFAFVFFDPPPSAMADRKTAL